MAVVLLLPCFLAVANEALQDLGTERPSCNGRESVLCLARAMHDCCKQKLIRHKLAKVLACCTQAANRLHSGIIACDEMSWRVQRQRRSV